MQKMVLLFQSNTDEYSKFNTNLLYDYETTKYGRNMTWMFNVFTLITV